MTIVKCDKDRCEYNQNGECSCGTVWLDESGTCKSYEWEDDYDE